jgi:hypothetical protein
MLPQPVVYNCIIPVEESLTTPSAIYHSPLDEPGEVPHKLPFPAYPEIRKYSQPLCFPTLRAVYFPLHSSNLSPEEIQEATRQYLEQHPDILDSALIEQVVTANSTHIRAWQHLIETGKFPQEHTMRALIDSHYISLLKSMKGMGYFAGAKAARAIWQSSIHGSLPSFYSASDAFAYAHEFAHRIAKWLYSGFILSAQAEEIYYGLSTLMTDREKPKDEVIEVWEFFEQANSNLIYLAKKFEPIEEIFAVYLGMLFLPPTVRETILERIEQALIKRKWFKAYEAFAKACDACQVNSPSGAAMAISEMVCRFLERIDISVISATSVIEAVTANFQIAWEMIKKEEEGETLTQEEKDALEKNLTKTIEQAGIPLEVAELVYESSTSMPNLERIADAIENNLSRPEDKELFPPVIMLIGRLSKHDVTPFVYPTPTEEDMSEMWDLRLMSITATKDLLDVGRNLIIIAFVGTDLHIRIFDAGGKKVIDKTESELISGDILTALKKRLNPFPDGSSLSKEDKQEIIRNATSIAGHTSSEFSSYEKIVLDSLRQQLALFFAVAHQRLTLPCSLVCPYAFKGKPCCGLKEELSVLYNRLPEEVRAQVIPPNCDLIR